MLYRYCNFFSKSCSPINFSKKWPHLVGITLILRKFSEVEIGAGTPPPPPPGGIGLKPLSSEKIEHLIPDCFCRIGYMISDKSKQNVTITNKAYKEYQFLLIIETDLNFIDKAIPAVLLKTGASSNDSQTCRLTYI